MPQEAEVRNRERPRLKRYHRFRHDEDVSEEEKARRAAELKEAEEAQWREEQRYNAEKEPQPPPIPAWARVWPFTRPEEKDTKQEGRGPKKRKRLIEAPEEAPKKQKVGEDEEDAQPPPVPVDQADQKREGKDIKEREEKEQEDKKHNDNVDAQVDAWLQRDGHDHVDPRWVLGGGVHYGGVLQSAYVSCAVHAPPAPGGNHQMVPAGRLPPRQVHDPHNYQMIPFGHPQPYPPHPYFPPVLYGHPQPYHQYPPVPHDQDPNDGDMVPYTPQNAQILRNNLQNKVPPTTLTRILDAFKVAGEVTKTLWKIKQPLLFGIAGLLAASYVETAGKATVAGVTGDQKVEKLWKEIRSNPNLITYKDIDGNIKWLRDPDCESSTWSMMANTMKSSLDGKTRTNTCALDINTITQETLNRIYLRDADPSSNNGVVEVPTVEDVREALRQSQDEVWRSKRRKDAEIQQECRDNSLACWGRYLGDAATAPGKSWWEWAKYKLG